MAMAVVLALLVVGSVLFHYLSPWYFTPIASNWGTIDDTVRRIIEQLHPDGLAALLRPANGQQDRPVRLAARTSSMPLY